MRPLSLDQAFPVPCNENLRELQQLTAMTAARTGNDRVRRLQKVRAKVKTSPAPWASINWASINWASFNWASFNCAATAVPQSADQDRQPNACGQPRLSGIVCCRTNMAIFHEVSETSFSGWAP
jgi:hypothetical protein